MELIETKPDNLIPSEIQCYHKNIKQGIHLFYKERQASRLPWTFPNTEILGYVFYLGNFNND